MSYFKQDKVNTSHRINAVESSRFMRRVFFIGLLLCAVACSRIQYQVTSEPSFKFGTVRTYGISSDWSGKAAVRIHPETTELMNKMLEAELQEKGYTRGFPLPPDLILSYRLEVTWDPALTPEQIKQRQGFSGSNFPDADPRGRDYQKLTLVLEAISFTQKKVVWSGRAIGVTYTPGQKALALVDSGERLVQDFPVVPTL